MSTLDLSWLFAGTESAQVLNYWVVVSGAFSPQNHHPVRIPSPVTGVGQGGGLGFDTTGLLPHAKALPPLHEGVFGYNLPHV